MAFDDHSQVLHWLPAEDRWEAISWDDWLQFRELKHPFMPLPEISGGIHYFIVCIHDDSTPINLIPHKYLIDPDGHIGSDNFAGLTAEERDDYNRIMMLPKYGPGDEDRLKEIRGKMGEIGNIYFPPTESFFALILGLSQKAPGTTV